MLEGALLLCQCSAATENAVVRFSFASDALLGDSAGGSEGGGGAGVGDVVENATDPKREENNFPTD